MDRNRQVRRIIIIEGFANLVVLTGKIIAGLSVGSMAILADAVHSLTDLMNNVAAWIIMHYSGMPADREHPYGHGKFETLAVFILALLLVFLAFELILNTVDNNTGDVTQGGLELAIMLIVLLVNIVVSSWEHWWANRLDSDILRADALHTLTDVLITAVVIAGWQLSLRGYVWIDQACGIGVALFVVYLAYGLFKRSIPVLVDVLAVDPENLGRLVGQVAGVKNVYRIRSRRTGRAYEIDLVVSVDPALSTEQSHRITDVIEDLIKARFNVTNISVHVEPDWTDKSPIKE